MKNADGPSTEACMYQNCFGKVRNKLVGILVFLAIQISTAPANRLLSWAHLPVYSGMALVRAPTLFPEQNSQAQLLEY